VGSKLREVGDLGQLRFGRADRVSVNSVKDVDLAPDGKRVVALMPATEAKGAQEAQNYVVFLENFFDELRRKVPVGKQRQTPLMAEPPRKQFIRNVLFG
jgi:hypothetical protein